MKIASFAAVVLLASAGSAFATADCHVGILGALGIGQSKHVDAVNGGDLTGSFSLDGGMAGGTAGCRWPLGGGYAGLEADYLASSVNGISGDVAPNAGFTSETRVESIGSLRAVFGGNVSSSWAFYGSLGIAAAPVKVNVCSPTATCVSEKQTMSGIAGGLAAEYAITRPLRLRLQYLYAGFQSKAFNTGGPANPIFAQHRVDLNLNQLRVGFELHF